MPDPEGSGSEVYELATSGGGCERCAALNGSRWSEPPPVPLHVKCQCSVELVSDGADGQRECGDNTWTFEHVAVPSWDDDSCVWTFRVTIDCWDGRTYEYEADVEVPLAGWGPELEGLEDFVFNELSDQAEETMAMVCTSCEPELNS